MHTLNGKSIKFVLNPKKGEKIEHFYFQYAEKLSLTHSTGIYSMLSKKQM